MEQVLISGDEAYRNTPAIPKNLDAIDVPWLSGALAAVYPGTVVDEITGANARHGTTTNVRLELSYRDGANPHELPKVMWFKSGMEEHSEAFEAQMSLYEREARFYRYLHPEFTDITPRCFYADFSPASRRSVTLLEGLQEKGARLNYSPEPLSVDDVALLLEALAVVHKRFFESPRLKDYAWLPVYIEDNRFFDGAVLPEFLHTWLQEPRAKTYPPIIHDEKRVSVNMLHMASKIGTDRCTLIHGDAHVGNSFHVNGKGGYYDWQCCGKASPMMDVAYCIGSTLNTDVRRANEGALIREYLSHLNQGASTLSEDEAWLGYRRYMIYGLWAWMINPVHIHPEPMNVTLSNRFANAVADHETFQHIERWD